MLPPTLSQTSQKAIVLSEQTDEQLIKAYREGDTPAFTQLVERYHDDLIRFLYRLSGNRTIAEEAFQETFLQIHRSADQFDVKRRFKPWLFTIAANKARDLLRKSNRRRALDLSAPIAGGQGDGTRTYVDLMEIDVQQPQEHLDEEERSKQVQQAIDQLPYALREILLLAYFQRMSYAQVAQTLEIPLGTVKSRLHSAVAAFAKAYQNVTSETQQDE